MLDRPFVVALAALAALAVPSARAAQVTDWGPLGPVPTVVDVTYAADGGPVDDVYAFSTSAGAHLIVDTSVPPDALPGATLTLWSGDYGSADARALGTIASFDSAVDETVFTHLHGGDFFLEVTSDSSPAGSGYAFDASSAERVFPVTVAEPADAVLLLAGLAAVGAARTGRLRRG